MAPLLIAMEAIMASVLRMAAPVPLSYVPFLTIAEFDRAWQEFKQAEKTV